MNRCFCAFVSLLLLTACAAPRQTFLHRSHRGNFALQAAELEKVQFYISTEVLARNASQGDSPESVVIVPVGTPGVVTETGPDWLRVSFSPGGEGAYFAIVPDPSSDSAYWIATRVDGSSEPKRLKDLDPKVIHTSAGDFRLIYGDGARLMINSEQLQELIEKRTHLEGRKPGTK